jgi:hypothetical protein
MTLILQLDALAIKRCARTAGLVLAGLCSAMAHATGPIDAVTVEGASVAALREQASSYEHGTGVAKDMPRALALYCEAARLGDADAQFSLGWIYANGRGVPRDDSTASFFFAAAAEQGIEQARRMLDVVGPPGSAIPPCMIVAPTPPPEPSPAAAPFQIRTSAPKPLIDLVKKMAPAYRIEPQLVLAIIEVESNFDSAALSPKNARGLMQLIPDTASRFNVKDAYDPKQNIRGGLAYLRWLLAYFEGDLALVAAAYNAGEGTVERYRGVPPYAETRRYVSRILQAAGSSVHPYDAHVVAPSPRLRAIRTAALGN